MHKNEMAVIRKVGTVFVIKIYHTNTKKLISEYGEFKNVEDTENFALSHGISL